MFSHAYVRPVWFKCVVVALPFVATLVDIVSWYLIKVFHPFVFVEIAAGGAMAMCFAFMCLVTLYQMWFSPTPDIVKDRQPFDV